MMRHGISHVIPWLLTILAATFGVLNIVGFLVTGRWTSLVVGLFCLGAAYLVYSTRTFGA